MQAHRHKTVHRLALHPGQCEVFNDKSRFKVVVAGRRFVGQAVQADPTFGGLANNAWAGAIAVLVRLAGELGLSGQAASARPHAGSGRTSGRPHWSRGTSPLSC